MDKTERNMLAGKIAGDKSRIEQYDDYTERIKSLTNIVEDLPCNNIISIKTSTCEYDIPKGSRHSVTSALREVINREIEILERKRRDL